MKERRQEKVVGWFLFLGTALLSVVLEKKWKTLSLEALSFWLCGFWACVGARFIWKTKERPPAEANERPS